MDYRSPLPLEFLTFGSFSSESIRKYRPNVVNGLLLQTGLPYSRVLSSHRSCVNALAISHDGKWLGSAGDDPYILLWEESTPTETIMVHTGSVRAISSHPFSDEVFLSASEDGCVILHDSRSDNRMSRAQGTLQEHAELTGVQFHPEAPDLFVTSAGNGQVCLRDVRMAFGLRSSRSNNGVVQEFVTTLAKPVLSHLARPEASSVTFDKTGSKLAVTNMGYLPTIYSLDDEYPLATCSGNYSPNGNPTPPGSRTYSNSCTMKHGSFGGPGLIFDEYYAAGSDNFCGYVWKIPSIEEMKQEREILTDAEFYQRDRSTTAFASSLSDDRYIPMQLQRPVCQLGGHKSIVNSALFHPHWPMVLTAGVERHITLHSPLSDSPCAVGLGKTSNDIRQLPPVDAEGRRRAVEALMIGPSEADSDDEGTIALFDEILRQEQDLDVFQSRRWSGVVSDPDSNDEDVQDDSDVGELPF
ncbi:WD40-repeat-containing domain protein [Irpex rosettiformis]|uniref:WD40-repeat-containing domain protein n=1 Tax=Irpex rosettiformis TaxID=378272 RepID=A0ACB8U175_9APHY|nr:WD40-repeat-containing domain protein [Irpex rosettiformis]